MLILSSRPKRLFQTHIIERESSSSEVKKQPTQAELLSKRFNNFRNDLSKPIEYTDKEGVKRKISKSPDGKTITIQKAIDPDKPIGENGENVKSEFILTRNEDGTYSLDTYDANPAVLDGIVFPEEPIKPEAPVEPEKPEEPTKPVEPKIPEEYKSIKKFEGGIAAKPPMVSQEPEEPEAPEEPEEPDGSGDLVPGTSAEGQSGGSKKDPEITPTGSTESIQEIINNYEIEYEQYSKDLEQYTKLMTQYKEDIRQWEIEYAKYTTDLTSYEDVMQKYQADLVKYDAKMRKYQQKYPDIFPAMPTMPTMPEKPEVTEPELPKGVTEPIPDTESLSNNENIDFDGKYVHLDGEDYFVRNAVINGEKAVVAININNKDRYVFNRDGSLVKLDSEQSNENKNAIDSYEKAMKKYNSDLHEYEKAMEKWAGANKEALNSKIKTSGIDKLSIDQINDAISRIEGKIKEGKKINFDKALEYAQNSEDKVHEQAADLLKQIQDGSYAA